MCAAQISRGLLLCQFHHVRWIELFPTLNLRHEKKPTHPNAEWWQMKKCVEWKWGRAQNERNICTLFWINHDEIKVNDKNYCLWIVWNRHSLNWFTSIRRSFIVSLFRKHSFSLILLLVASFLLSLIRFDSLHFGWFFFTLFSAYRNLVEENLFDELTMDINGLHFGFMQMKRHRNFLLTNRSIENIKMLMIRPCYWFGATCFCVCVCVIWRVCMFQFSFVSIKIESNRLTNKEFLRDDDSTIVWFIFFFIQSFCIVKPVFEFSLLKNDGVNML